MANQIIEKKGYTTGIVCPDDFRIEYHGVWDFSVPALPVSSYGAVYIKINFTGTGCVILYDAPRVDFQYSIDNGEFINIPANSNSEQILATGLSDGEHSLIFTRRSQCVVGNLIFKGFKAPAGCVFKLKKNKIENKMLMEFIGDSITGGCLNECVTMSLPGKKKRPVLPENAYMAYGPQTARLLNADWTTIAIGGAGLCHNWQETVPETQKHMQDYFISSLYEPINKKRDFSGKQPDCVVVALGTNDFGSGPFPKKNRYKTVYSSFLRLIRSRYKQASIFCIGPLMFFKGRHTPFDDCREQIQKAVIGMKDKKIFYLDTVNGPVGPWLDRAEDFAGDWTHPVINGHIKIAGILSKTIIEKTRLKKRI